MIRSVLTILLPLATPFLLYYALITWKAATGRQTMVEGEARRHPWFFLTLAGLFLAILSIVAMALGLLGGEPDHPFAPARLIDGQVIRDGIPPAK